MTDFIYPYAPYREPAPKRFAHAYFEDATMTIGNTNTEWITSDTTMALEHAETQSP